jgi:pyruvate dehydrogenase E2 component (dihydrolipoamide acetyltransferase)
MQMGQKKDVLVPDLGNFKDVPVIEVLVKVGDTVKVEQNILTLESEKTSMDIPSPIAGKVTEIYVQSGVKMSFGDKILALEVEAAGEEKAKPAAAEKPAPAKAEQAKEPHKEPAKEVAKEVPKDAPKEEPKVKEATRELPPETTPAGHRLPHASPSIRKLARELGADLNAMKGQGPHGRITIEDVKGWVKNQLTGGGSVRTSGGGLPALPVIDFKKFGEIELLPLNRVRRIAGKHLHACWVNIPHVTQFDEADITEMEAFRKQQGAVAEKRGVKLTPIAFLLKAVAAALKEFPQFNASLDETGENLILKKYINIGVAVDTPDGLVVPVVTAVDTKGIYDLAREVGELAQKARDRKLKAQDLQGGCFSISSLGGIGGTAFTPIVNAPEVAILGVSRAQLKPVYEGDQFVPRLMLPLSLSYDHRVIDGADGARFTSFLSNLLSDIRRLIL